MVLVFLLFFFFLPRTMDGLRKFSLGFFFFLYIYSTSFRMPKRPYAFTNLFLRKIVYAIELLIEELRINTLYKF